MKRLFLISVGLVSVSACGAAAGSGTQGSQADTLGSTQAGAPNSNGVNAGTGADGTASGQVASMGGSDGSGGANNPVGDQMGTVTLGGRGGSLNMNAAGSGRGGSGAEAGESAGGAETAGTNAGGTGVAGSGVTIITAGTGAAAGSGAVCTDSAPGEVQADAGGGTVEATAGTFTDHCDDNGDLVEYACDVVYVDDPNCAFTGSGPTPAGLAAAAAPLGDIVAPFCNPLPVVTGNVSELVTACAGRCEDAVCPYECPVYDDLMTYVSIDQETGAAVFAFDRVGSELSCELIFDRDTDDYSCLTSPEPGREIVVPSLGLNSRFCLEGNIGNIGMDDPTYEGQEECAYRCDIVVR